MTPQEYKAKREAKIERYRELSAKAEGRSNAVQARSRAQTEHIPFGQPILVGHHSERKHRNALDKAHNLMRKSVEESKKADYYADKAKTMESNSVVSSDDPEAPEQLQKRLNSLEILHAHMLNINKLIRAKKIDELIGIVGSERAAKIMTPNCFGNVGFEGFELTSNTTKIKRLKKRIAELSALAERVTLEYEIDGVRVLENTDDNRLQLFFDGKPDDETRARCKAKGFKWSPTNGAWQRQLNSLGQNARYWAKQAICKPDACPM